jgi:dienelactone hydrolase
MTALLASLVLAAPGLYKADPGPFAIGTESLTIERNLNLRSIPLRVTYPKFRGAHPTILLSHGFRGSRDGLEPLARHWSSHGYIVIRPTYADSARLMPPAERRRMMDPGPGAFAGWAERALEARAVLDQLRYIEATVLSPLGIGIDRTRVGAGGHSFGAHTTAVLGGMTFNAGPNRNWAGDFSDPRPAAFLLLSPPAGRPVATSYQGMNRPAIVITGSEDTSPVGPATNPEDRKAPYERSPAGGKHLLWIEGAHHDFGGVSGAPYPGGGPRNETHIRLVASTGLAFWDAYLKRDGQAWRYLQSDAVEHGSAGEAKLTSR